MRRRARAEDVSRDDDFPATPLRRRLLIAGLAVATAVTLILMMLERVGAPPLPAAPPVPDAARCAVGQDRGCLGGRAEVILVPARPATPASAGADR
jgi:hypothetical protein